MSHVADVFAVKKCEACGQLFGCRALFNGEAGAPELLKLDEGRWIGFSSNTPDADSLCVHLFCSRKCAARLLGEGRRESPEPPEPTVPAADKKRQCLFCGEAEHTHACGTGPFA